MCWLKRVRSLFVSLLMFATPALGAPRLFMTAPGGEAAVAASVSNTVYVLPGAALTLEVWIDNTSPQQLGAYQIALPASASPLLAAGTVTYVDTAPPPGGSVFIDTADVDWAFAGIAGTSVFFSETGLPVGFAFLALAPSGVGVVIPGLAYLGEFQFEASVDASGTFTLDFLPSLAPPNGGTALTDETGLGAVFSVFQTLIIKIGSPPVNDECAGKSELLAGDTPFDTNSASTSVPNAGFGGAGNLVCDDAGDDTIEADLWYNHTTVCGGPVTVETCSQAVFDTRIEVYEGCGVCPPSILSACNDDAAGCIGGTSSVSFNAIDGACYTVRVGGVDEFAFGTGVLSVSTDTGRCAIDGVCYGPGALNPMNDCEACDPLVSIGAWTPRALGSLCGDPADSDCDHADTCDAAGTCKANLEPPLAPCGSAVDTDCDHADTCDGLGICLENLEPPSTACGDPTDTDCDHADSCNGVGVCLDNLETNASACSDGLFCTQLEFCTAGVCGGGTTIDCGDGIACTTDTCDEINQCQSVLDAGFCLIGGACTPAGTVNPANACEACDPLVAANIWSPATAGVPCGDTFDTNCDNPDACDGFGACAPNPEPNGTPCPNGVFCDGDETCQSGVCVDGADPCVDLAHCDEIAGACLDCLDANDCGDVAPADGIVDDRCFWYACDAGACDAVARVFADVGGPFGLCPPDGFANVHDRNQVLACFAQTSSCDAINADIGGQFDDCAADGFCNVHDVNHVLRTFEGTTPCFCPLDGGAPAPFYPSRVVGRAHLTARSDARLVGAGDLVTVRVFVDTPLADLQSYQLDVGVSGGRRGSLDLVDVAIDDVRDYVFAGTAAGFRAFNVATSQMLSGLESEGVATFANAYLATYRFRASGDAWGAFVVDVRRDGQTYLIASSQGEIRVAQTTPAVIVVAPGAARDLR